jgi:hypothetical protein
MSFPPGTEMFQFPGFASLSRFPCGWVSPFGYPRINGRSPLPAAFRSVPRPSSPLSTKASTKRPSFTLDIAHSIHFSLTHAQRRHQVDVGLRDLSSQSVLLMPISERDQL